MPLAARVKGAGLKFLLDFHYSDTWADPGKQTKPAGWKDLSFQDLEQRLYEYNRDALAAFRAAGASPEYVQVGNEIIGGLLWPDGRVGGNYENPRQWEQLGRLLKAAIRGVREGAGPQPPGILLHIDRGGDWGATRWFFDNLRQQAVEFDIVGQSYYPFWHGTLDALRTCLNNTAQRYAKPIAVVETAFPWTNAAPVLGLPATPAGQAAFVVELVKIVKGLPRDLGVGIFWWGTEYRQVNGVRTAGFENRGFFDRTGEILPAAAALGQSARPVVLRAIPEGAGLRLSWPATAELVPAATTDLRPPISWTLAEVEIQAHGTALSAFLPVEPVGSRFFRLQRAGE